MATGPVLVVLLLIAIAFIIVGTAKLRVHPFVVLLVSAYGLATAAGLPAQEAVAAITDGFGGTLRHIGIVIAAGTIIGVILERCGAAQVMADTVIRWVGRASASLAMSITGAAVSIPVFCDSGFVVLSPLARSLAAASNQSMATYAVALSMGLYTTHVFVPPTPGPIAAAGELGADIGMVVLLGLATTVPVVAMTYIFAVIVGRRIYIDPSATLEHERASELDSSAVGVSEPPQSDRDTSVESPSFREAAGSTGGPGPNPDNTTARGASPAHKSPTAWQAFAPIAVPVMLIALLSVADLPSRPFGSGLVASVLTFVGNPNTALLIGVFIAFGIARGWGRDVYGDWVGAALKAAGAIILITGAGGSFGRVLQSTALGTYLGEILGPLGIGPFSVLLPFLIAATLKTALGSSTVAIITTASIVAPLVDSLGLATGFGPVLTTLAIGAGSMTVSHANDSYFWVVSQFSGMSVSQAYVLQTGGSAVAGITGIIFVLVLSFFLIQ